MANPRDAQDTWVEQVLNVDIAVPSALVASGELAPETFAGIVAYRKALLAFGQAKSRVAAALAQLHQAIPAALLAEADLADQVAEQLGELNDALGDAIDDAINAASDARAPYTATTKKLIDYYIKVLADDELVQHVDANPLVPVKMAEQLTAALGDIRRLMV